MARNVNHAGRAGYVEGRPVAEGGNLEDGRRAKHPLRQRETDEAESREPDPEHFLVLGLRLAARHLRVELVHAHRHALFAAQALGKTDVVDVRVSQDERSNVVERATHRVELARQIVPVTGRARVNDRDLAAVLDQV